MPDFDSFETKGLCKRGHDLSVHGTTTKRQRYCATCKSGRRESARDLRS